MYERIGRLSPNKLIYRHRNRETNRTVTKTIYVLICTLSFELPLLR